MTKEGGGSRSRRASARGTRGNGDVSKPAVPASLFPAFGASMGWGVIGATGSPVGVVLPLVFVGLAWLALVALGLEVFPPQMVSVLAIPPVGTSFDFSAAATVFGVNGSAFGIFVAMTIVRSVIWAVLIGVIDEAMEFRSASAVGFLRGLRAFPAVLVSNYMCLSVVLVGQFFAPVFFGPSLGQTAVLVSGIGGLFFLAFAPVAAVRQGLSPREAVSRSSRGARLPGWPRHLLLCAVYFFLLSFLLPVIAPGAGSVTANPGFGTWAFVLGGTVLNMVFLGAFIHRWKAVENDVPAQTGTRR